MRTRVLTTRVLFDGLRAVGVECNGERILGGKVILAAGAINTPQLMQLSGIGNARFLEEQGVQAVHDLPGVGENLQDHLEVYIQHKCRQPVSMNPFLKWYRQPLAGLQWLLARKGPAATNHFEAGGFVRSNDEVDYPNLMFHFLPLDVRYDGSTPASGHGYQVHVGPMYSNARGSVKIASTDPTAAPQLQFNYLATDEDRREWVEAVECARRILRQSAMDAFNGGEISPGPEVTGEDAILDWVRRDAETALHPSCTCRMGLDENSVVNPRSMAVHGLDGLYVVDASAMPYITNGNIYAPVMMLAEKAADLILENQPLAALDVDYFRANSSFDTKVSDSHAK